MSERLRGKTCVLMGGGSPSIPGRVGNGQAVALTFAREGANVVVVDLDESAADETVRQIQATGRPARAMRADASKHEDVRAAIGAALSEFGRIDILYNNVGIEVTGGVLEASEESWDRVHAVNLKSVFLACKEGGCPKFCVRGARRLVHGGGRRLRRTADAVGKSVRGAVRNSVCEVLADLSTAAVVACDERPTRWASRCGIITQRSS